MLRRRLMKKGIPEGAINGKFSVSADKLVYFSKGNLQATTANLGSTWTWSFAENQWDYIGGLSSFGSGSETCNNLINGNGTLSANGTIDLFGWSTAATVYGIHNSEDDSTYSGDFKDWGSNAISNGGNKAGLWRTLTGGNSGEWKYLLNTRTVNGGTGNGKSYTLGKKVNGVSGIVLYPDNYTGSTYSGSNWSDFEAKGCVFLPAAGQRQYSARVNYAGSDGLYWSSTNDSSYACYALFTSSSVGPTQEGQRFYGNSVRLVYDIK